jgi:hypothetical protein
MTTRGGQAQSSRRTTAGLGLRGDQRFRAPWFSPVASPQLSQAQMLERVRTIASAVGAMTSSASSTLGDPGPDHRPELPELHWDDSITDAEKYTAQALAAAAGMTVATKSSQPSLQSVEQRAAVARPQRSCELR